MTALVIEWPQCSGTPWVIPAAYAITAMLAFFLGLWAGWRP